MQYKFERSVFDNSRVYETVVNTLLIGYAKNVNRLSECATDGSMFDTNVILYGVTESSAKIRASDTFKGTNYVNIRCAGSDTDLEGLQNALGKNRFNGHVIICPDVEHARDHVYYHLAKLLEVVACDHDYRKGRYNREFLTLIPNTNVENDLLWAMFENWKARTFGSHRNILIENAEYRFSRYFGTKDDGFEYRQKNMAKSIANGEPGALRIAPPHELDPALTYAAFLDRSKTFDTTNLHPVRLGRDFAQLRHSYLREIIDALSPYGLQVIGADGENVPSRVVCLDDYVAWKMFETSITTNVMYPPEYQTGGAACCGSDTSTKPTIVSMEEISKR